MEPFKKKFFIIILGLFVSFFLSNLYYKGLAQNVQSETKRVGPWAEDTKRVGPTLEDKVFKNPISIVSPSLDLTYRPGQEIDIVVEAEEEVDVVLVTLSTGEYFTLQERPFHVQVVIPEDFINDKMLVVAIGKTGSNIVGMDRVQLDVYVDVQRKIEWFMRLQQEDGLDSE